MTLCRNTLSNASIISGSDSVISNVIRHNVIRGGGLHFDAGSFASNTIEGNFVSGSPTDGIFIRVRRGGGGNVVQRNTSIDNAGGDLIAFAQAANRGGANRVATKAARD